MEIISDTCLEWCPYCEEEVELQSKLDMQVCPSCGKPIWPCNLCEDCTADCPMKEWTDKNGQADERDKV